MVYPWRPYLPRERREVKRLCVDGAAPLTLNATHTPAEIRLTAASNSTYIYIYIPGILYQTRAMCGSVLHKTLCRMLLCRMWVLLAKAGLSAARRFFGETPLKHAAGCPSRPRTPQRTGVRVRVQVRVRVRPGVGLVWAYVQG